MTLLEEELARILRPLVAQARAVAGALVFTPPREAPVVVRAAGRRLPARLDGWLQASVRTPVGRLGLARATPPGWTRGRAVVLKTPLVASGRRVGALLLLGPALTRGTLTPDVSRALGEALDRVWRLHRRALRMSALDELTRLLVVTHSLDDVFRAFAEGAAKLVAFDSIAVSLLDAERDEFEIIDVVARSVPLRVPRDDRMALAGTLFADLVARGTPLRVDDVRDERVPGVSRRVFAERGYRAVTLVPLLSAGGVFGAVTLTSARVGAFDAEDVEIVGELARPLASAIELRRLLTEGHRRRDELAALYATSQLITARLDVESVLDRISRSVSDLIGSSGCGIGLLDPAGTHIAHVAAHGAGSEAWRTLSVPVGEGIMGRAAQSGTTLRVDDVRTDPHSARRDVDEREGIRSMLCVPLKVAGGVIGVDSCGLATLDPLTDELVTVASLDLPQAMVKDIRIKVGEGIGGRAVRERRPVQSRDLYTDPRVRYPQLPRAHGLRSMLVAPLLVGDRAIGAISAFRRDVHEFSASEAELLLALADQAAIALEHARLYAALEGMVAERTRELDAQKRFVEVVLETLPLGVFVLGAELHVVRTN